MTSGSTGKALKLYSTQQALQFQWAVWWRHRARFGLRLGDPYLSFGARVATSAGQTRPPFWRINRAANQTYLSTYHLTPANLPAILDFLNRTDFDFFAGYPSMMAVLANLILESGARLTNRPKVVVCGAESLLPAQEQLLSRVFGVRVTDQYGAAEGVANLARCEHDRYHEDFEFCIVQTEPNPLDPAGPRRIIGTALHNPAMPLIRYEIGDLAHLSAEPCPCGRATPYALRIDGRNEDYVRTPDGRCVAGMNQVFKWVAGAREIQIVQNELERIVVRVVRRESYSDADTQALLRELRARLGEAIKIEVEFVDSIERGAGGKLRCVVSTVR